MNKKSCCGVIGCGCFLVVVAIIVGSYYGVGFLHGKGVEFAASGLTHTVEKLTEVAFADEDRKELNSKAAEIADKIRTGEIGLLEVMTETGQQLEGSLHNQAMLLAFYRQNYEQGELPDNGGAEELVPVASEAAAPAVLVDKLIWGMMNKKVSQDQAASLTAMLVERHTETIESKDGQGRISRSVKRLKKTLTEEDKAASLALMREICESSRLEAPAPDFSRSEAVKKEIIKFFDKLQQAGKKE
ncbi:MAG: hypothetical protein CVV41_14135 [Candidatus Riflebacteria bacterium HGW-Riflebacteria-1]|jgi:hypothetical protein|nr:MAG: hypothetical protein CVV41_14135 [Candidatus Riflebacteria bacterium HGW-Riflebacteria-1]